MPAYQTSPHKRADDRKSMPRLVRTPYDKPRNRVAQSVLDTPVDKEEQSTLRKLGSFSKSVVRAFGSLWQESPVHNTNTNISNDDRVIDLTVLDASTHDIAEETKSDEKRDTTKSQPAEQGNNSGDAEAEALKEDNELSWISGAPPQFDLTTVATNPDIDINANLLVATYRRALLDDFRADASATAFKRRPSHGSVDSSRAHPPTKFARLADVPISETNSNFHPVGHRRPNSRKFRSAEEVSSIGSNPSTVVPELPARRTRIELVLKPIVDLNSLSKEKRGAGFITADFELDDDGDEAAPIQASSIDESSKDARRRPALSLFKERPGNEPENSANSADFGSKPVFKIPATTAPATDDSRKDPGALAFSFGTGPQNSVVRETETFSPGGNTKKTSEENGHTQSLSNSQPPKGPSGTLGSSSEAADTVKKTGGNLFGRVSEKPSFSFGAAKQTAASGKSAPGSLFVEKPQEALAVAAKEGGQDSVTTGTTSSASFKFGASKPSLPSAPSPEALFGAVKPSIDKPTFAFGTTAAKDRTDGQALQVPSPFGSKSGREPSSPEAGNEERTRKKPFKFGEGSQTDTGAEVTSNDTAVAKPLFSFPKTAASQVPNAASAFSFGPAANPVPASDGQSSAGTEKSSSTPTPAFSFGATKPAEAPASTDNVTAAQNAGGFTFGVSKRPIESAATTDSAGTNALGAKRPFAFGTSPSSSKEGTPFSAPVPASSGEPKSQATFGPAVAGNAATATAPAGAANAPSGGFTFGATSSNAASRESTPFGAGAGATSQPAGGFTFGSNGATAGGTTASTTFGAPSAPSRSATATPNFTFGANSTPNTATGPAPAFGPSATTPAAFGANTGTTGGGFNFGANSTGPAGNSAGTGGFVFGSSNAAGNSNGFSFGTSGGTAAGAAPQFGASGSAPNGFAGVNGASAFGGFTSPAPASFGAGDAANPLASGTTQDSAGTGGRKIAQIRRRLPQSRR